MNDTVKPSINAWFQTTAGIVLMLLGVQFFTGATLAFYYVPSVDHAYTTVSYIELALSSGSWLRSLHHYGSQWLPFFVFLHLVQLHIREAYKYSKGKWLAAIVLLALVMAAGGTGYSLPWDARAFFSTRVAEGLLAGLPLAGRMARLWLLGGTDISTITLSRFFALHVLITPFLILGVIVARVISQSTKPVCWPNISKNAIVAGVVFLVLGIWSLKFHAPLGPAANEVTADYLPRPGGQFLWLYQSLKYVPGGLGSIVGVVIPSIALLVLLLLPWLKPAAFSKLTGRPQHLVASVILGCAAIWIVTMTTTSYLSDRRDPKIRQQLTKQEHWEAALRTTPFKPVSLTLGASQTTGSEQKSGPAAYIQFCASCHGVHGEGATQGTLRFPPLIGVGSKPRRTVDDIVNLLNDPTVYGIEPPMRSFATKLTEQEKKEIAEWVVSLR